MRNIFFAGKKEIRSIRTKVKLEQAKILRNVQLTEATGAKVCQKSVKSLPAAEQPLTQAVGVCFHRIGHSELLLHDLSGK